MKGEGFRRLRIGVAAAGTVLASLFGAVTRSARASTNLPVTYIASTRWRVQSSDCADSLGLDGHACGIGVGQFTVNNTVPTTTGIPTIPTGGPTSPTGTPTSPTSSTTGTSTGTTTGITTSPTGSPTTGTSPSPTTDSFDGLGMIEAHSKRAGNDPFDHATVAFKRSLGLAVDNKVFTAPAGKVDVTGNTLTTGPQTIAGLSVNVQYRFTGPTRTVRAVYTFANPTSAPITARVNTNIGGFGGGDVIKAGSSGNYTLTTADRWIETLGGQARNGNPPGPSVLFVDYGKFVDFYGRFVAPARKRAPRILKTIFGLDEQGGIDCVVGYDVTVDPGYTLGIMVFAQANASAPSPQTVDSVFGDLGTLNSAGLLADLPIPQDRIVNWSGPTWPIGPTSPVPPPRRYAEDPTDD